jgi:iron(III) transport system permease protein
LVTFSFRKIRLINDATLASVLAIHLDEQGDVAGAVAMAMLIVYVSIAVRLLRTVITKKVLRKTQAWRYNIVDIN